MIDSVLRFGGVIAALVMILSIHIWLAYLIGKENNVRSSLKWLVGLAASSTLIWIVVTLGLFYACVDCFYDEKRLPLEELLFRNTLAAPLSSNSLLCDVPLLRNFQGGFICAIGNLLLLPATFFGISLIVVGMTKNGLYENLTKPDLPERK